ncbi:MAG: hypothetical protein ACLUTO_04635 [Anaerostipes sp.]
MKKYRTDFFCIPKYKKEKMIQRHSVRTIVIQKHKACSINVSSRFFSAVILESAI